MEGKLYKSWMCTTTNKWTTFSTEKEVDLRSAYHYELIAKSTASRCCHHALSNTIHIYKCFFIKLSSFFQRELIKLLLYVVHGKLNM